MPMPGHAIVAGGTNTTIVSVTHMPNGWRVITSTVYANDQHAPSLALARRLLPLSSPLGPAPLGPGHTEPVFFTQATVSTGNVDNKVFAAHLMLLSANATGAHVGQAAAVAYPPDGFVKVGSRWVNTHGGWLPGGPLLPCLV